MDQETQTPAPDHERRLTLYRFCAQHKLYLSTLQRIAIGQELTKLVMERKLPLIKVRERIGRKRWCLTRLYPEALLNEWLARYTETKAQATADAGADGLSEPQLTAANS